MSESTSDMPQMTYEEFARKMDRYTRQLRWLAVTILGVNVFTFVAVMWVWTSPLRN